LDIFGDYSPKNHSTIYDIIDLNVVLKGKYSRMLTMRNNDKNDLKKIIENQLRRQLDDKNIVVQDIEEHTIHYFQLRFSTNTQKLIQFFKKFKGKKEQPSRLLARDIYSIESPDLFSFERPTVIDMKFLAWSLINLEDENLKEKEKEKARFLIENRTFTGNLLAKAKEDDFSTCYLDENEKLIPFINKFINK
jgi:hypothetical protein